MAELEKDYWLNRNVFLNICNKSISIFQTFQTTIRIFRTQKRKWMTVIHFYFRDYAEVDASNLF